MNLIDRETLLWKYLTVDIKDLVEDGEHLVLHVTKEKENVEISDFSFVVFPFAKAYEGFLKKLFLDLDMISHEDYYGDEIRIGRILNPRYTHELKSIAAKMFSHSPARKNLTEELWETWRVGRNRVFHYFPHNFRKLSYDEAMEIIHDILKAMHDAVIACEIKLDDIKK